ncbi:MAG TPA: nuclear transport factor 2 family protein [Actinomycetota bacterium]|nr:nuclear transport factor 2 family protein [Actinomycetota bacterium]
MGEREKRGAIERHWEVAAHDQVAAQEIYHEDVVVEWPQSGERIRGVHNLKALRESYPAALTFTVRRIIGRDDLWVSEYVITYDGSSRTNVISVMEFRGDRLARETHYFGQPLDPPAWRAQWVEPLGSIGSDPKGATP